MTTSRRKGSPKAWSSRRSTALFTVLLQAPHLSGPASPQSSTDRSSPPLRRRHPHFFCSMPPGSVPSSPTPFRPTTHAMREGLGSSRNPGKLLLRALAPKLKVWRCTPGGPVNERKSRVRTKVYRAVVRVFCGTVSMVPPEARHGTDIIVSQDISKTSTHERCGLASSS